MAIEKPKQNNVIAVCGKGGVGKTAFTSMLTRVLADDEGTGKLLVIDADPALGLLYALGEDTDMTIGTIREEIMETAESGDVDKQKLLAERLDYMTFKALNENERYSFLAMGRTDTKGCYCSINDLLRDTIWHLSNLFDTILIDGEAGLEQINRQVVDKVNTLIIVTDTSFRGLQTVKHIKGLVESGAVPKCDKMGVVFNRIHGAETTVGDLAQSAKEAGVPVFGIIPYDEMVEKFDLAGKSLFDLPDESKAVRAIRKIFKAEVL